MKLMNDILSDVDGEIVDICVENEPVSYTHLDVYKRQVDAAGKALENAAVSPDKIDLIIATTLTGEYVTPSLSCIINGEIGTNCPCFDINAACTGFLYALNAADAYFMAGKAEYILVVSSEEMSKFANWTDRSTAVLFGDGAGACVLKRCLLYTSRCV